MFEHVAKDFQLSNMVSIPDVNSLFQEKENPYPFKKCGICQWAHIRAGTHACITTFARVNNPLFQRRGVGARSAPRRATTNARLCVHSRFDLFAQR